MENKENEIFLKENSFSESYYYFAKMIAGMGDITFEKETCNLYLHSGLGSVDSYGFLIENISLTQLKSILHAINKPA